jgi:hypothetical protein
MNSEDHRDLLWMGYRRTHRYAVYAKPIGYYLLVYSALNRSIASYFIGADNKPYVWTSASVDEGVPLKEEIPRFETYHLPRCCADTPRDMGFLSPEQLLEL